MGSWSVSSRFERCCIWFGEVYSYQLVSQSIAFLCFSKAEVLPDGNLVVSPATTTTPSACCTPGSTKFGRWRWERNWKAARATPPPPASRPSPSRSRTTPSARLLPTAAARLNELREGWLNPEGADGNPAVAEEADADQPLQPAPGLAGQRPRDVGRRRSRRLRLARRAAGRRDTGAAAGPEPGTRRVDSSVGNFVLFLKQISEKKVSYGRTSTG